MPTEQELQRLQQAVNIVDDVANGPATGTDSQVTTLGGPIKTVARVISELEATTVDVPDVQDWALNGNTDRLPDNKIPESVATNPEVIQEIEDRVQDWARDDTTVIPEDKLPPAANLDVDAVDGRIRAGVQDWAETNNLDRIPENKISNEIARTSAVPDVEDWAVDGNTDTIPNDKISTDIARSSDVPDVPSWATTGNTEDVPEDKIPNTIARTSELSEAGLDESEVDARVRAGVADWAEEGNTDVIPSEKLPEAQAGGISETEARDLILEWAREGNTDLVPNEKLDSRQVITPGVLLGLANGDKRFIDQGDVVFDQAWTARDNITSYTALATAEPGVTPVAIATTFSGPPTGDELEYETTGGLRGSLITFRGNANDGSVANFQWLLASTGEYFRQLTSGAQFQRVGKGVAAVWAERGNSDLIPLSKLPTLGLSHSELDITYDFGQSLFSNIHELGGEPDPTATGKTHVGNAVQDLRFRTVGGEEILAGEGYIEFRARVVQEDGTTYTDPLPRRFTLTGLEKDRRYLAEELQSHHGTTEVDIDFAIQLRDNVNGAGEIIPGVRITLTATQTNQDNPPVFGILLLEYARPIANVDVDERIQEGVEDWAQTGNTDLIPASKLVDAHTAIPIEGPITSDSLNEIGPGVFLFTNSAEVLGVPTGTWLLTSNQNQDTSVDLYQEVKRIGGGDPVTYTRRKITGTWVDADVFVEDIGGVNEADVDARISTWAREGNTDQIPADKLENAGSDNAVRDDVTLVTPYMPAREAMDAIPGALYFATRRVNQSSNQWTKVTIGDQTRTALGEGYEANLRSTPQVPFYHNGVMYVLLVNQDGDDGRFFHTIDIETGLATRDPEAPDVEGIISGVVSFASHNGELYGLRAGTTHPILDVIDIETGTVTSTTQLSGTNGTTTNGSGTLVSHGGDLIIVSGNANLNNNPITLFNINISAGTYSVRIRADNIGGRATNLASLDGVLYFVTSGEGRQSGGTVRSVDADTGEVTFLFGIQEPGTAFGTATAGLYPGSITAIQTAAAVPSQAEMPAVLSDPDATGIEPWAELGSPDIIPHSKLGLPDEIVVTPEAVDQRIYSRVEEWATMRGPNTIPKNRIVESVDEFSGALHILTSNTLGFSTLVRQTPSAYELIEGPGRRFVGSATTTGVTYHNERVYTIVSGRLFSIDFRTGVWEQITDGGLDGYHAMFSNNGQLHAFHAEDSTSPLILYTINTETGVPTEVETITGLTGSIVGAGVNRGLIWIFGFNTVRTWDGTTLSSTFNFRTQLVDHQPLRFGPAIYGGFRGIASFNGIFYATDSGAYQDLYAVFPSTTASTVSVSIRQEDVRDRFPENVQFTNFPVGIPSRPAGNLIGNLPVGNAASWAQDNAEQIPASKLGNANIAAGGGLNEGQVDTRVRTIVENWAEVGNTEIIPESKLPQSSAGGVTQSEVETTVRTLVEDWAETSNATLVPDDKLSTAIARTANIPDVSNFVTGADVDTAIQNDVEDWARDDTTVIPANKIPEAHINFDESLFTTYVVGQVNDALYRVNPITQEFSRVGNIQGFGVNEFNPTGIANILGTLYVTGERRKLIRLNVDEDLQLTGGGTELAADNTLPEGIRSMTDRLGELIAAVDDPHSTAVSLIDIDKATGLSSNSRALTGTTQIADITTSPTGEIHGCCPIGSVWNLCLIPPQGGPVIPVGAFTSNGANVTINTLWWEGNTLKGISNEIGDDDIYVIDPSTGAMRELAMTNAFGVGEFLPQGAVAVPHYQSLPVASPWARQGDDTVIPNTKISTDIARVADIPSTDNFITADQVEDFAETGNAALVPDNKLSQAIARTANIPDVSGFRTEAEVDQAIVDEVEVWARDDTTPIPADKLSNTATAAFTATRIQGTGAEINGFASGRASFVISGNPVLGLPAGEYLLVATLSNLNGVHLNQEATNATTNQKFIRHNTDGVWTSSDTFVEIGGGSSGGGLDEAAVDARVEAGVEDWAETGNTDLIPGSKIPPSDAPLTLTDHYIHIGTPDLDGTVSGVLANAITPSAVRDLQEFNVRFDNTLPMFNVPTNGHYEPNNGDITLPAGHWLICASLNVVSTPSSNSRVAAVLSINHGTNQRHAQALYLRNDESQVGADGISQVQGKVSVTGAVISDGTNPIRIRVGVVRQTTAATVTIQGAHVHGYQQLVGGFNQAQVDARVTAVTAGLVARIEALENA